MRWILVLSLMLATAPCAAQDTFVQGPERVGEVRQVAGKVIGVHQDWERNCAVVLADQPNAPAWSGLGGGGRFFLCSNKVTFQMGQAWKGRVKQTDTRLARVGPRWRVLPLFEPAG